MRGLSIALVLALGGCDGILGIRDLPRGYAPVDAGDNDAAPPVNVACVACEATCARERTTCIGDAACDGLYRCISACAVGDVLCRDRCEQARATTANDKIYQAFDVCRRRSCAADCYGSFGFATAIDGACSCLDARCAAQMLTCVQSPECEHRIACVARQPNPDGVVDCTQLGGNEAADGLLDCMRKSSCADAVTKKVCPIGDAELGCLNNFVYARSRAPNANFNLLVQDFEGKPVVGAQVKACSPSRCAADCIVLATGTTDKDGNAPLALPLFDGGYDGCLRVEPLSTDYMATSVFTGRRVHLDERVLSTISLQEALLAIYAVDAKVELRKDRGHIIVAIHDCLWTRLGGATLNITGSEPDTVLAYLEGATVITGATKTSASGVVAIVNVTPGKHDLIVTRDGIEVARQTIAVSAGELTDANVYPSPK